LPKKQPVDESVRKKALEIIEQWIREEEKKNSNNDVVEDSKQDE
jgi:hypothetical protein